MNMKQVMMAAMALWALAANAVPVGHWVGQIKQAEDQNAKYALRLAEVEAELQAPAGKKEEDLKKLEQEKDALSNADAVLGVKGQIKHHLQNDELATAFIVSGYDADVLLNAWMEWKVDIVKLNSVAHLGTHMRDEHKIEALKRVMRKGVQSAEPTLEYLANVHTMQPEKKHAEAAGFDVDVFLPVLKQRNHEFYSWFLETKMRVEGLEGKEINPSYFIRMAFSDVGYFSLGEYANLQNRILASAQYHIIRHRRAEGLPVVKGPEKDAVNPLDACFVDIVAALNAPLWTGLEAALRAQGVDCPDVDRSAFIEATTTYAEDMMLGRGVGNNVGEHLGYLQLLLGVDGLNAWIEAYNAQ